MWVVLSEGERCEWCWLIRRMRSVSDCMCVKHWCAYMHVCLCAVCFVFCVYSTCIILVSYPDRHLGAAILCRVE